MREPSIKELLRLYEEGKATEEQRRLVESWLTWHQQRSPQRNQAESGGTGAPDQDHPNQDQDHLKEIFEKIRLAREQAAGEVPGEEAPVYELEAGSRRRRYGWIAAASVALIVTIGLLWPKTAPKPAPVQVAVAYKTIQTRPGETVHLLLPDSSEVWLNAGARLRYPQPFGDSMRRLELLDGEAYFQIHPNAGRGFVVQTERMMTRVLGTSFNIKAYRGSQQMSVAVTSGKVSVSNGTDEGMIFTAGQQARYNTATEHLSRGTIAVDKAQDWKDGKFEFTEESLGDIAIQLEHYYNVHIQFRYPGLRKYVISAGFPHTAPLKVILTTLCLLNQNHLTQTDDQHYVIH